MLLLQPARVKECALAHSFFLLYYIDILYYTTYNMCKKIILQNKKEVKVWYLTQVQRFWMQSYYL